jgi:hypothetical protein
VSYLLKRWWQPALLLFLLFVISACGETPVEVLDTPSPESPTPAEAVQARPSPAITSASTSTVLPTVTYNGIQFAFDESALGPLGANEHHSPIPPGAGFVQPEHLEIQLRAGDQNSAPTLYIFPVQQYEAMSEEAAREIAHLRNLLAERPEEIAGNLPFLPMYGAIQNYHSDPKYIDFKNGSGISFLTNVDHDHSLITDHSLFYTFQGLTNDNRFYVATLVPISNLEGEEPTNTADASAPGEAADHNAKAAISHGNWISVDLGDGRTLIDDIMHSLDVQPDESFPSIKLPHLFTSQGLLIAYDEAISGMASVEYSPALIEDPEGEIAFLPSVPDIVTVQFQSKPANSAGAELQIQPVRDDQGQFYEGIPEWLQQKTISLEQDDLGLIHLRDEGTVTELTRISFQNGLGFRGITTLTNDETDDDGVKEVYLFKGASEDGRYLVELRHPLPESLSHENAVFYLDSMVNSLIVAPNTSNGSSMPVNSVDCENEAEFVEDVSIPDYTIIERGDQFVKIWRIRNAGSCTWSPTYQVAFSQGNPVEWQEMALAEIVSPGEETEVSITVQSPEVPGIYQAWWQLSDEQGQIFGDQLGLLFEAPKAATDIPGYGVIEGEINYPANGNPAVDIYFLNVENGDRFSMRTEQGWTHYSNAVPIGTYYVFSRVAGDTSDSGGGYTKAVICGLHSACTDHNLIEVIVEEGRASREINLYDWYAPAGSFPFPPPANQEAGS